jgi:protein-S-isoprenylcysteine O-methyltransferase Ste14
MSDSTPAVSARRNWWVRSRAIVGILIIAPFALGAVLSPPLAIEGTWTDISFDLLGWVLFVTGAGVRWWATLYIGGRKLNSMIAEGPYSICRNQLYCGTILMGLGAVFFLQSLTFALGFALATTFYLWVTVPAEEALLRDRFGPAFSDYCLRVPRYLPRFANFETSDKIEISIGGLRAEAFRALRWIWLPALCEGIAQLRAETWWPQPLHLP